MAQAWKPWLGAGAGLGALVLAGAASAETMTYTYDVFGQLKSAVSSAGSAVSYNYDTAGNRTLLRMGGDIGPVANTDSISVVQDQVVTFDPRTNDTDADSDVLGISGATNGAHGAVSWAQNLLTYTPAAGYVGSDTFNYTIADGRGQNATGTVTMNVIGNRSPVPVNDSMYITMYHGVGVMVRPVGTINPLVNDTDPDGDTVTIYSASNGAKGTVTVSADHTSVTYTYYTSVLNLTDTDSFTYTISDGHGHTATATVSVNIDVETVSP